MQRSRDLVRLVPAALVLSASIFGSHAVAQPASKTDQAAARTSKAERFKAIKSTATSAAQLDPNAIGDFSRDKVFTSVTPCRIVDTRVAGGAIAGGSSGTFDVDGTNFAAQGGVGTGCSIPFGVPSAVAMTITSPTPSARVI